VGAEFFRAGTDRHAQTTVAFRNFAKAPKSVCSQATTPSAAPQMSDKRQLDQTTAYFTSVSILLPESPCYDDNRHTPST
jgi:hypothetical protein